MKKILLGGSPCTFWSVAQRSKNIEKGWDLFENYLIAMKKFAPDIFLYENNHAIPRDVVARISDALQTRPQLIDSALVSAQRRKRLYFHNFGEVAPPPDKNVSFQDIIEKDPEVCKIYALNATQSRVEFWNDGKNKCGGYKKCANITNASKTYCLTTKQDRAPNAGLIAFDGFCRTLTIGEACQLQTLPKDYCDGVSKTQAFRLLGNGWTANVVTYLLNVALKNVPRDEELHVLSLYDGIATGLYCIKNLGFEKISYHAYEIDKAAIKVAKSNHPEIVEMGDAYKVRGNWRWEDDKDD